MELGVTISIGTDGKLKYKNNLLCYDPLSIGEDVELEYTAFKQVHKAFEEAVKQVNSHLEKEGIDKKLAAIEQ